MNSLVLLRPGFLATRNLSKVTRKSSSRSSRLVTLILLSFLIIVALYRGSLELFTILSEKSTFAYLHPSLPLTLLMAFLSVMILFSNLACGSSSLFFSKDLDLLLSSPVKPGSFFFGKFLQISFSSSWMVLIFGFPVLFAFGIFSGSGMQYASACIITLVPFFLFLGSTAMVILLVIGSCKMIHQLRSFVIPGLALLLAGLTYSTAYVFFNSETAVRVTDLLKIFSFFQLPVMEWLPSSWATLTLRGAAEGNSLLMGISLTVLYSATILMTAIAYLCYRFLYPKALHFTRTSNGKRTFQNSLVSRVVEHTFFWTSQSVRAMIKKEYSLFSRDLTQALQLLVLAGLCFIYFYNFRFLTAIQGLPQDLQAWWQYLLVGSNIMMSCFVVSAVCNRFVFPSLSLEGKCYWILQSSPIPFRKVLQAKFLAWYIPVLAIFLCVITLGGVAVGADFGVVLFSLPFGAMLCYSTVALAIGLGAYFLNLDWKHPGQLVASYGSLMFMVTSAFLIVLNLALSAGVILLVLSFYDGLQAETLSSFHFSSFSGLFLVGYLNWKISQEAFTLGAQTLEKRGEHSKPEPDTKDHQ